MEILLTDLYQILVNTCMRAIQETGATMSSGQREQGRMRLGDDDMLPSFG
jgi:hypothetical protein